MSQDRRFSYRTQSNGAVAIFYSGRLATPLRGPEAEKFLKAEATSAEGAQQLMARLTGNYKRGNERAARSHPR